MSDQTQNAPTWRQLLTLNEERRYAIETYWSKVRTIATEEFKWRQSRSYQGNWFTFALPAGPIDQIGVWARTREWLAKHGLQLPGDPDEVLEIQVRYSDPNAQLPQPGQLMSEKGWQGVNGAGSSNGKKFVRILIDVSAWKGAETYEAKTAVLADAFVTGLRMFEDLSGLELPGLR